MNLRYLTNHRVWLMAGVVCAITIVDQAVPAAAFPRAFQQEEKEAEQTGQKTSGDEKSQDTEEPTIDTGSVEVEPLGPREIRLHLWDGTVVTGNLNLDKLHIETSFGVLEVPVSQLETLRPGLSSLPKLKADVQKLIEDLDHREFQVRERAHQQLAAMGPLLKNLINEFSDGGSGERKRHLQELVEEINEQVDDFMFEADPLSEPLGNDDAIRTGEFTIVGNLMETEFALETQYGTLNISLGDVRLGDRTWNQGRQAIRKNVDIAATAFFQREPVKTRIRVNRGDRIMIQASGNVNWTSWGNISSSPDGIHNQGSWQGINSGTLTAKIGNNDTYIKVGTKGEFVAKTSGELMLGIAIPDNYANQQGYQWDGSYEARVTVQPTGR